MTAQAMADLSGWIQTQAKLTSVWAEGVRRFVSGSDAGREAVPADGAAQSVPRPSRAPSEVPWLKELEALWGVWAELASGVQESAVRAFTVGSEGGPQRAAAELVQATLGRVLESPGLGFTREFQEKSADALTAWSELWKAQTEYAAELGRAGQRAWEIFDTKLAERKREGGAVEDWSELLELWSEAAEQGYFAVAGTPEFVRAQARMTNTAMRFRLHSRELAAEFYRAAGLPTSGDVEESFRSLHEVKRRMRALEREMDDLRAELRGGGAAGPHPAAAPRQPSKGRSAKRREAPGASPSGS